MQLLDGRLISQRILSALQSRLELFPLKPRLDIILVGSDPASLKYVQLKQKIAQEIGVTVQVHQFPADISTARLISQIDDLNANPQVTGFFVQLPLPPGLDKLTVLNSISPFKDVDGLTSANLGLLFQGHPDAVVPAAALGAMSLLDAYDINLKGRHLVIVNNSPLIGLPLLALAQQQGATVTLCHEHTLDLASHTSRSDILITAVGRPNLITAGHIKTDAVVVDIGTAPDPDTGRLVGDVDFAAVSPKTSYITPVPGGVGPMTVACLLSNLVGLVRD